MTNYSTLYYLLSHLTTDTTDYGENLHKLKRKSSYYKYHNKK